MSHDKRRTRAKFLPEEDTKLRELVETYGTNSWEQVAALMPGRNIRQCRERWKHYLSSDRPYEPWTKEEDQILYDKVQELGAKWTKIARFLPGRTDLQAKTRWQKIFSGKAHRFSDRLEGTVAGRFVAEKQQKLEEAERERQSITLFETTIKTKPEIDQLFLVDTHDEIDLFNTGEFQWYDSCFGTTTVDSFWS